MGTCRLHCDVLPSVSGKTNNSTLQPHKSDYQSVEHFSVQMHVSVTTVHIKHQGRCRHRGRVLTREGEVIKGEQRRGWGEIGGEGVQVQKNKEREWGEGGILKQISSKVCPNNEGICFVEWGGENPPYSTGATCTYGFTIEVDQLSDWTANHCLKDFLSEWSFSVEHGCQWPKAVHQSGQRCLSRLYRNVLHIRAISYSDNVQYIVYFIYYEYDKAAGSMSLSMTLLMH